MTEPTSDVRRFDSLILASDFTATSDRVLPIVGRLAQRGDLPIRMVTTASPGLEEYDLADLAARAEQIHGCSVTTVVINGDEPAGELAEFAGQHSGGLVCLASHGRTAIGDILFGSMTEKLLRRHVGPMLAIGPGVPTDYVPGEKLLVGIDSHALRTSLLDVASAWHATFGGTVELFEAVTRNAGSTPIGPTADLVTAQQSMPAAAVSVVESQDPVRAILDAAAAGSVIAVSSHVRSGIERVVLGSVAAELLHRSQTPVLIVPG